MKVEPCAYCQAEEERISRIRQQLKRAEASLAKHQEGHISIAVDDMPDSRRQTVEPYQLCACGCGERTLLARRTHKKDGYVKGQPIRYVNGHARRTKGPDHIVDEDGCWVWVKEKSRHGYGWLNESGKQYVAHRAYYERHKGPIQDGLQIDHLCRNRACVNPDHLEPVTMIENLRRANIAKLDQDKAREIRGFLSQGIPLKEIATRYGVSTGTIRDIRDGKRWKLA